MYTDHSETLKLNPIGRCCHKKECATVLIPESRGESQEPPKEIDAPIPPIHTPLEDSDTGYASSLHAEQIPFAIAAFVYAKGEPRVAIPTTCMIGRDADSTATTVGSWVGALHGVSGLSKEWVDVVCEVNLREIDIRGLAEQLALLPV